MIERKQYSITWHYRRADWELGIARAEELQERLRETVCKKYPIEILTGKTIVEVRPKNVNKGEVIKMIFDEEKMQDAFDFVLCAGDDRTDEDMFRALKEIEGIEKDSLYVIAIGATDKQTVADWSLHEPSDVIDFLAEILERDSGAKI